ncbi:MAG: histidine phosphatase family protein [Dehalococcoidia bacterium]|nr:histidine phosphatase family protein [Dehalococcoidia bacterium]
MRLILIRHGESEGNASGVVQGRLDFGLSERGERQAMATAARLHDLEVERIIASPLRRATETARAIAEPHGLAVELEPALMEYDIGIVSGLTGAEIRERHPEVAAAYARGERPRFPGEEGREAFRQRIAGLVDSIHRSESAETVVAVAHGGVVNAICGIVLGLDIRRPGVFQVANCSLTELVTDRAGRLVLRRHNDVCHLDGLLTTTDRG